jgi:hypothetical protein
MRTMLWLVLRGTKPSFARAFGNVAIGAHLTLYLQSHKSTAQAFYRESILTTPSNLEALDDAKWLVLKDPRDGIYAFMELSQDDAHCMTIDPYYFAPFLRIDHQFGVIYIYSNKNLELLDYVCHDVNSHRDV